MTRDEFKAFKKRHRLTNETFGAIVGYSKRYCVDLSSGSAPIPAHIEAACWAYDHGWRPSDMLRCPDDASQQGALAE